MQKALIRRIKQQDDHEITSIIRQVLISFDADKDGTAFTDDCINCMYQTFQLSGSCYLIAENMGIVLGGGGIYPTPNLPNGYCELVKLYLVESARGKGLGKQLIEGCITSAKSIGYTHIYLETMPELSLVIPLYRKMGFTYLENPLGSSGHYNCKIWMKKKLN